MQQDQRTEMIPWDAPDGYLSLLVESINAAESGASLYLTLTVSSGIVNGELIAAHRWWTELSEQMQAASSLPPGEPGFASLFRDQADSYRERAVRAQNGVDPGQLVHIHLRDARVYAPGQPPLPTNGTLWRGRLSEISGWGIGKLGGPPGTP